MALLIDCNHKEYIICDYMNYLYVAYLLGITHFDPIKYDLNYDIFFSNKPKICIKLSSGIKEEIDRYIKNDLSKKCYSLNNRDFIK